MGVKVNVKWKFKVGGKEYASVDELPENIREAYERAMAAKADGRSLDTPGADTKIVFNGKEYGSVEEMPAGYHTQLGKWFRDGRELSGGQWQKVALSRAFMRESADVLVLDEPTAAMDARAEAQVFEQVRELAAASKEEQ